MCKTKKLYSDGFDKLVLSTLQYIFFLFLILLKFTTGKKIQLKKEEIHVEHIKANPPKKEAGNKKNTRKLVNHLEDVSGWISFQSIVASVWQL